MATFAACRYAGKIGTVSRIGTALYKFKASSVEGKSNTTSAIQFLASLSSFSSPSGYCRRSDYQPFSQFVKSNGGRFFLVDTLALVRKLEAQGIPSKHAEAITSTITEVLNDSLENVAQSLVSKGEIQKIEMTQESNLSKFKSEVESSQGHHFSLLQHETEKLRSDIEKMRSELRRIQDELANQNVGTTSLTNKLDWEIHALRAQLEAAKYDVYPCFHFSCGSYCDSHFDVRSLANHAIRKKKIQKAKKKKIKKLRTGSQRWYSISPPH